MANLTDEIIFTVGIAISLLITAVGIITLFLIYRNKQLKFSQDKLNMQIKFDQEILQTHLEIQEQTFKNISQEIHDNVGQVLSLAKLNLNTISDNNDPKIIDTKNLVSKAITDLRNLSRSIQGDRVSERGLINSINDELQIIQNTGHFSTNLFVNGTVYKLESKKETMLFRITQEALNNVVKHSKASNIIVELNYLPTNFYLRIIDNGVGFNSTSVGLRNKGLGLTSMQNRASLIGGKIQIFPGKLNGCEVNIDIKI